MAERHVLVVDDEPSNRTLVRQVLEHAGHRVEEADGGVKALESARLRPPDTVLLDIMMPDLDGLEVCRRLKGSPDTAAVPILLVTSLDGREDRLAGVEAGADDFLVKPIDPREVRLRVRNAVRASRLYREVQEGYRRLRELEALRDSLTHMLVHDFRSPLQAIQGYLRLLQMEAEERLTEDDNEILERALTGARTLEDMVAATLDVSRMESQTMPLRRSPANLGAVARAAASGLSGPGRSPVRLEVAGPEVEAWCDPEVIRRVVVNLLGNALKFSPRDEEVRVLVQRSGPNVRVEVIDRGPGIPAEHQERIFEKFFQLQAFESGARHSSGLGLTFCQMAVQAHGGRIGVRSQPGQGSAFWFELPAERGASA